MFQLIFTGDTIDQGRVKINDRLFTGVTANSPWQFIDSINTGTTSLEMSGVTSLATNNEDTTDLSANLIVGLNNSLSGYGGYNFVNGTNNYIASSINSFIKGNNNSFTGLTDSFISGDDNTIYGGNYLTLNSVFNTVFSANTLNNNYVSILGSFNIINENQSISSNKKTNFLTVLNESTLTLTADTEYVSVLPGNFNSISGSVTNSLILGSYNWIGTGSTGTNDNIYIFGTGITPSISAGTKMALSGTYINNLCIENSLILNKNYIYQGDIIGGTANIDFFDKNQYFLTPNSGNITATVVNNFNKSSIFFVSCKITGGTSTISGSGSFFEDYARWDIPSNYLKANVIFVTSFQNAADKLRYKG